MWELSKCRKNALKSEVYPSEKHSDLLNFPVALKHILNYMYFPVQGGEGKSMVCGLGHSGSRPFYCFHENKSESVLYVTHFPLPIQPVGEDLPDVAEDTETEL